MRTKTKYFSLLLATVILLGLLAACSANNSNEGGNASSSTPSSSNENAGQNDAYELTLALPVFGAVPKDLDAVQAEINKISQSKINATVKILPISIGAWAQQMNLMMSSGEKLDLAFTFGQSYSTQVANGQIQPISDLLAKHGKGIEQAVGTEYMKSAEFGGKIYGVPTIHDFGGSVGIMMRKDLVEKYQIDVASIHSLDDLDNVFKTIKENEPGIAPLAGGIASPLEQYLTYDKLGDGLGVLPGFDNGLKVVNYFESSEYADLLNRMHSWFQAGYINKDASTSQLSEADIVKANKAFSWIARSKPGFVEQETRRTGKELVWVDLMPEHYATTSDVLVGLWTISQNSENTERAMKFLNLMYTDEDLANLMMWGIEGKHYVKASETTVDYPTGVDSTTVGYSMQSWLMGNPFLTYTYKTDDPELWNKTKAYNKEAIKSKALGFAFNTEPVKNEITAINNVAEQYRKVLETGTVDPAKKLPDFISKLKAAGIDKVIAEKQMQLDAWAAAKQ